MTWLESREQVQEVICLKSIWLLPHYVQGLVPWFRVIKSTVALHLNFSPPTSRQKVHLCKKGWFLVLAFWVWPQSVVFASWFKLGRGATQGLRDARRLPSQPPTSSWVPGSNARPGNYEEPGLVAVPGADCILIITEWLGNSRKITTNMSQTPLLTLLGMN